MIRYIVAILLIGLESNCRENIWQTFNQFKYDVSYQTNIIREHLNHLAKNGQKDLALAFVDNVHKKLTKQYLISRSLATAIHVPLTFVYPCISYCKDGLTALAANQACSSFLNDNCPQFFHVENELYWHTLRGQNTQLRFFLILSWAAFNVYNYSKRLSKHNTFYLASENILASIRHTVEQKKIKTNPLKLLPAYTPVLIDAMDIHHYNFEQLWNDNLKNMIRDAQRFDHSLGSESLNIIKRNLEQDKYYHQLKCMTLCCTLFLFSYTKAIIGALNSDDLHTFNHEMHQGDMFNLFFMLPFSPFLYRILSKDVTNYIDTKLKLLADFQ